MQRRMRQLLGLTVVMATGDLAIVIALRCLPDRRSTSVPGRAARPQSPPLKSVLTSKRRGSQPRGERWSWNARPPPVRRMRLAPVACDQVPVLLLDGISGDGVKMPSP